MRSDTIARRPHRGDTRAAALLALLLVAFAVPSGLVAQGVRGVVVDEETTAPLPGVLVSVLDGAGSVVGQLLTDNAGRFTIATRARGSFRARAERIGLRTVTTEPFRLTSSDFAQIRIALGAEAVEVEGFVVDARVRQCRIDPTQAVRIQRWWDEVRKALTVSALVQREALARFRVQQFERDMSADLRSVASEETRLRIGFSSRPFVSAEPTFLSEGGFVQGEEGSREYYAPDAEVLISDIFLSEHCFSIVADDDRPGLVGLAFEPTRVRRVPDILGTLWVDTASAELRSLEYRYANLDWLPANEAGGEVGFRYLPSGAWVVSDWFIRMPRVGVRREARPGGTADATVVIGYHDTGGRVRQLSTRRTAADGRLGSGRLTGIVVDSIRGGPLVGARVQVMGTRFFATTDAAGRFAIEGVPAGAQDVVFFHPDLTRWGLGSTYRSVTLEDSRTVDLRLAVPAFRRAAISLCGASGREASAVLTGRVVDGEGEAIANVRLGFSWTVTGGAAPGTGEARTGSDGRFAFCYAPAESLVSVAGEADGYRVRTFTLVPPTHEISYREIRAERR
jgi:Carboxypeptidase regulatory-like domain